jgi:hypothetical protein
VSGSAEPAADTWQQRRERMRDVCRHCHGSASLDGFYGRYDELVELINDKFTAPGVAMVETLRKQDLISHTPMDETIEWVWFDIWHRHARRARMGAAMMSPDDVHGHGLALVARDFYGDFLDGARDLAEDDRPSPGGRAVLAAIRKLLAQPEHRGRAASAANATGGPADDGESTQSAGREPPAGDDRGF